MSDNINHIDFDSYADYRCALTYVLSRAQNRIWLCEKNLEEALLDSLACYQLLLLFLNNNMAGSIRILVKDAQHLLTRCPRIMQLRQQFSHRLEIRELQESPITWQQGFVLTDDDNYIKRIHFDWPRGEIGVSGRESAILEQLFDRLWEYATPPAGLHLLSL